MGGAPVPTDKILEAFFGPAVEDPNRSFQSSLWIGPDASPYRDYLIGLTMPVLDRFAGALRCSLPARSDEDCHLYNVLRTNDSGVHARRPAILARVLTFVCELYE